MRIAEERPSSRAAEDIRNGLAFSARRLVRFLEAGFHINDTLEATTQTEAVTRPIVVFYVHSTPLFAPCITLHERNADGQPTALIEAFSNEHQPRGTLCLRLAIALDALGVSPTHCRICVGEAANWIYMPKPQMLVQSNTY